MKITKKWIQSITFSVLAFGLVACGTADDTTGDTPDENTDQEEHPEETPDDSSEESSDQTEGTDSVTEHDLTFTLDVEDSEEQLRFTMTVENDTDAEKQIDFASGQKFDIKVKDESGTVVYHFAEGMMFTQALVSETIAPGESLVLEETWDAGEDLSGKTFDVEAMLNIYSVDNEQIDKSVFDVKKQITVE
ncbi:hypothetical protein JSY36_19140 [Bacillus sp. H-16]|uniref:BsuPI-related putative proteinase inhibitor n=1 Tax=Alteribacter salitolerans TaxID=2912333 RepID=UPI0019642F82|nr:BsuPI-related putative proteinase inhibitor [Alteribacter salitolerans]MBM7097856.1 hypothetical protein [Alteribacter salitolerans]